MGEMKGCVLIKAINCYVNKHKGQCTHTQRVFSTRKVHQNGIINVKEPLIQVMINQG